MATLIVIVLIVSVAVVLFRAQERAREYRAWWDFVRRERSRRGR